MHTTSKTQLETLVHCGLVKDSLYISLPIGNSWMSDLGKLRLKINSSL